MRRSIAKAWVSRTSTAVLFGVSLLGATALSACTVGFGDDDPNAADAGPDAYRDTRPDMPSEESHCNDGVDNDGDGYTDCVDPGCRDILPCSDTEYCTDEVDNDGDGRTDCADHDCDQHPDCVEVEQQCADAVDNDDDGFTDCEDFDCEGDQNCLSEICDNQMDDDDDGQTDCVDSDCESDPACLAEVCNDGIDNDGDGYADCDDLECLETVDCPDMILPCRGVHSCLWCCPAQDTGCYDACAAAGPLEAVDQYNAYADCSMTNCQSACGGDSWTDACWYCLETNCLTEYRACDWAEMGTEDCQALNQCISDCTEQPIEDGSGDTTTCPQNSGLTCHISCRRAGTPAAGDALTDVYRCLELSCSTQCADPSSQECQTCLTQECVDEVMACSNT
jgi:hypothetical protein